MKILLYIVEIYSARICHEVVYLRDYINHLGKRLNAAGMMYFFDQLRTQLTGFAHYGIGRFRDSLSILHRQWRNSDGAAFRGREISTAHRFYFAAIYSPSTATASRHDVVAIDSN